MTPLIGIASAIGLISARDKINPSAAASPPAAASSVGAGATGDVTTDTPPAAPARSSLGDETSALIGRFGAFAGHIGSEILASFEHGFKQVQEDLQVLGHSVGVSYPLVEYFVLNPAWNDIGADVDFMDKVVWDETDRRGEFVRIASAAFGPIGVFAVTAATPTERA